LYLAYCSVIAISNHYLTTAKDICLVGQGGNKRVSTSCESVGKKVEGYVPSSAQCTTTTAMGVPLFSQEEELLTHVTDGICGRG
jgi:hypothetical protein